MSSSSSSIADDGAMLMKLEPSPLLPPLLAVEAVAMLGQQEWGEDEEEGRSAVFLGSQLFGGGCIVAVVDPSSSLVSTARAAAAPARFATMCRGAGSQAPPPFLGAVGCDPPPLEYDDDDGGGRPLSLQE